MRTQLERLAARPTFASMQIRNYRVYFLGQLISLIGVWMQVVALSWVVLDLTGSGTSLGLVIGTRFAPVLLLGPWAGLMADRLDKRMVIRWTQAATATLAFILAALLITDSVNLIEVYVIATLFGLVNTFDGPVRQTFITELVGIDHVRNAVTLNSVMIYIAQIIGPAIGGVVIAVGGAGWCFMVNGVTSLAVIVSLTMIDGAKLHAAPLQQAGKGQVRAGLTYVRHSPELLATMVMIAVGGTFAWEFQITLPLIAKNAFDGQANTLGWLMAAMGAGAVVGGLAVAARPTATARTLALACMLWGATLTVGAAAPTLQLALPAMVLVGIGTISFSSTSKSTLQLTAAPHMRGRVMALWSVCVTGSTPIGAPIVGWIGQHFGARWSLVAGGIPTFAVGLAFYAWFTFRQPVTEPAATELEPAA
jgi:MFS family permease